LQPGACSYDAVERFLWLGRAITWQDTLRSSLLPHLTPVTRGDRLIPWSVVLLLLWSSVHQPAPRPGPSRTAGTATSVIFSQASDITLTLASTIPALPPNAPRRSITTTIAAAPGPVSSAHPTLQASSSSQTFSAARVIATPFTSRSRTTPRQLSRPRTTPLPRPHNHGSRTQEDYQHRASQADRRRG
jgi:hypothetical protein